jgi:hypothetical protein
MDSLHKSFKQDLIDKKNVSKWVQKMVELGGDPTPWFYNLDSTYQAAYLTMVERELVRLSNKKNLSKADANALKKWQEIYNITRQ